MNVTKDCPFVTLFGAQGFYGVFFGCAASRQQAGNDR